MDSSFIVHHSSFKKIMASKNKTSRFQNFLSKLKAISARDIVQGVEGGFARIRKVIQKSRSTFYRLVVLNNDTLEQVGTYRLSIMNFYVALSSLVVGFTILGICLIVFTPMKKLIPGYGGIGSERTVFELSQQVEKLEKQVKEQQTYVDNVRKLLTGKVERESDMPRNTTAVVDSNINVEPSAEELQVRAGGITTTNNNLSEAKAISVSNRNDRLESMYLSSPLSGQVSLGFDLNKKHYGIDIIAPKNTPIKAVADGFVISSDWTLETGNTIAVQHANNVVSFYKHNSSLLKKSGDMVKSSEAIAIIGNTGELTSGPHLHFELWKDGKSVNPSEYIRF
jgi:murein DD-endopeptidase MepM/ murein hydrolase activator NlpD